MPQANKVLITVFELPFLTIMGKLTYIIILWQAICGHLEEKGILLIHYFPGTVTIRGTMQSCQRLAFSGRDKAEAQRTVGCRRESECIICPVELKRLRNIGAEEKVLCTKLLFIPHLIKTSWVVFSYHCWAHDS
jgi:hypothetical protein